MGDVETITTRCLFGSCCSSLPPGQPSRYRARWLYSSSFFDWTFVVGCAVLEGVYRPRPWAEVTCVMAGTLSLALGWAVLARTSAGWRGLRQTPPGIRLRHDLRRQLFESLAVEAREVESAA